MPSPWLVDLLGAADRKAPLVLLMRHAARGPLPDEGSGDEVPLLLEGVAAARALGERLGARLATLRTSPVRRCAQTADAIGAAAQWTTRPSVDRCLGAPGLFVLDADVAWSNWLRLGHAGVMSAMIAGETLPGMDDPKGAAHRLVAHIVGAAGGRTGVHVFVTHDSLLAATIAHTVGCALPIGEWPDFMEALAVVPDGRRLVLTWRDRTEVTTWR